MCSTLKSRFSAASLARSSVASSALRSAGRAARLSAISITSNPVRPSGFPEPKNYNPTGYLKKAPTDPWGTPYVYISAGDGFELYSLAADGVEGGEVLAIEAER